MRRTAILIASAAALVVAGLPTSSAEAATSLTRVSLSATVSGRTVDVATVVRARSSVVAQQYGVCVRDGAGRNADFGPKATEVAITTTGTAYRATGVFAAGSYVYFPCTRVAGSWAAVGAPKLFTVRATGSAPSPSPSPAPSTSPSPSVTPTVSPSPTPSTSPSPSETPTTSPSPSASPSPTSSPVPTPAPGPGAPTVLFSDDFSGTGDYDHGKWGEWSACTYNGSAAYGSIGCGDRARLDGEGHLSVPASPGQGTSLSTGGRFQFTYGTVTARMKVPTEVGYWPAFWMLNNNPTGRPNSTTVGEVDVIEAYTTFADGYRRASHNYTPGGTWSSADDPLCGGGDIRGSWHDYSAKVESGQVTFYVDGKQCGPVERSSDPEAGGRPYAFGPDNAAGNWLLLTLAIGGAGGQQKPATAPAELLVDSVTVTSL